MRYGSLFASAAVLAGLAGLSACKGNDSGMNADLAKDLASAKAPDALALAPRAGVQTVVSAQELSPQSRARMASSSSSSRAVAHHTPHRDRVASAPTPEATPVSAPVVEVSSGASASTSTDEAVTVSAPSSRPQPVDVLYPPADPPIRGTAGSGGMGGIIGAIGGAILRGGAVDGDHCDPRGRHGGGILINRRGPILRGTF